MATATKTKPKLRKEPADDLTPAQAEMHLLLVNLIEESGGSPTIRELCRALSRQQTAVLYRLDGLEEKGYIERRRGVARGLRVLKQLPKTGRKGA